MSILKAYLANVASAIKEKKGIDTPINAQNFTSEILSIQGGASLNLAYGLTPPADTTKIWLQCVEPSGVEVQNYLGEVSVGEVANYGGISNPVDGHSVFYSCYYNIGYMDNNQIAIVGYNHIRIYDLMSKKYIADYIISVSTSSGYTNVLFKNNVLYFGYGIYLYSFDLSTQTLSKVVDTFWDYNYITYIFFSGVNTIDCLVNYNNTQSVRYRYNLITKECTTIINLGAKYFSYINGFDNNKIIINNTFYHFYYYIDTSNSNAKCHFKFNLLTNKISDFTSLENFANAQGWTQYRRQSLVYDGERYVYLIGGTIIKSGETSTTTLNDIVRYDIVNDTFERLGISLLGGKENHFSVLVDNRAYIFGGSTTRGTRPNQIDYFDLKYDLPQNNVLITTNTINTDNNLPLINTDKLKLNSNIASAYKGNANNLAEKLNAYYWNGTKWVGINCEDYVESSGTGGGLGGSGDATTDPNIPVDKPVEM